MDDEATDTVQLQARAGLRRLELGAQARHTDKLTLFSGPDYYCSEKLRVAPAFVTVASYFTCFSLPLPLPLPLPLSLPHPLHPPAVHQEQFVRLPTIADIDLSSTARPEL